MCGIVTYRNLEGELLVAVHSAKGIENRRKLFGIELDYGFQPKSVLELSRRNSARLELVVDCHRSKKNFPTNIPSTTAPMTWWILPVMALSVANRAPAALNPVETAGLKAHRAEATEGRAAF